MTHSSSSLLKLIAKNEMGPPRPLMRKMKRGDILGHLASAIACGVKRVDAHMLDYAVEDVGSDR
jgi:hypothetical protein